MDAGTLKLDELLRALSRCMEAHPPEGVDFDSTRTRAAWPVFGA